MIDVSGIRDDAERQRATALIGDLEARESAPCPDCDRGVCGHAYVLNVAMGFKDRPRCTPCLATALGREHADFLQQGLDYVDHRPCFRSGWQWADGDEAVSERWPTCVAPAGGMPNVTESKAASDATIELLEQTIAASWDAGDMSCGDLVLELRLRLNRMAPGQVLQLTATDPGAPEDLPAWCGLTGHALVQHHHPRYFIRRKEA